MCTFNMNEICKGFQKNDFDFSNAAVLNAVFSLFFKLPIFYFYFVFLPFCISAYLHFPISFPSL